MKAYGLRDRVVVKVANGVLRASSRQYRSSLESAIRSGLESAERDAARVHPALVLDADWVRCEVADDSRLSGVEVDAVRDLSDREIVDELVRMFDSSPEGAKADEALFDPREVVRKSLADEHVAGAG